MKSVAYIPRQETRARAVYDLLQDGQEHRWKECFEAYRLAKEPWSNPHYISLTLGPLLKRIATRVRRGVYVGQIAPADPYPFDRKFKPGDRIRYRGGYGHFDNGGVKKGSVFTVDFYGDRDGFPELLTKGWVFLKEKPSESASRGGHDESRFDLVRDQATGAPEIADLPWGSKAGFPHLDAISDLEKSVSELRRENDEIRALLKKTEENLVSAGEALEDARKKDAKTMDDLAEARSQCDVLQEQIEARNQVIKNQLGWIARLETRLAAAKKALLEE